ncbi:MAG TPA: transglutaminase-like domain-containing protein [Anaeromyxobacteraceae bacterium]|nr:transglutaminase-like domain-containing protein [Anaeromyxobacteraceae bacterium]
MIAGLLAAAAVAALPEGGARYRVEIAGEVVGTAVLAVRCAPSSCAVTWESRLRAPAEAGGGLAWRRVEVEVDRAGRFRGGRVEVRGDGAAGGGRGSPGAVPAALAEVALLSAGPGESCLDTFDEESGEAGRACGRWEAGALQADLSGVRARIAPGPGGFPAEVALPEQGARFVADPGAAVPERSPRLHGTRVPGPGGRGGRLRFCGVEADPERHEAPGALPPPAAEGADCREQAARWIAAAGRTGIRARTAVGVAWDGEGFAWHAWAEALVDGAWIAVDPAFGQSPARGPRFTLGHFAPGDAGARDRAGRRILACWGRARVERIAR